MLVSAPRGWTQIHFSRFQLVCDLFRPCSHRQAQTSRLPTCSRHPYFLCFSSSETGIRWFDELKFDDPNSSHHRHLPQLPSNRLVSRTSHASTPGLLCYTGSRFGTLPAPVVYHPSMEGNEVEISISWIWMNLGESSTVYSMLRHLRNQKPPVYMFKRVSFDDLMQRPHHITARYEQHAAMFWIQ